MNSTIRFVAGAACVFAMAAATLTVAVDASATTLRAPVVRTLGPQEAATVDGLVTTPQADLNLKPAVAVTLTALRPVPGKPPVEQSTQAVQRRNLGVDAAVYASVPASTRPLLPQAQVAPHLFDFQQVGDSVQAWATMTAQGVPHLFVQGFGHFRADATASWTGRFTLAGTTSKEVVLRFMVPPTQVSGATEEDAPAWWRAKMRTDVLVNGFPAWSTEALRLRADFVKAGGGGAPLKPLLVLQTFGDPLSFPTNDEDEATGNDSNEGNDEQAAAARWVHLSLGRFQPGQTIDLAMIVRGSAYTETASPSRPDRECQENPAGGWFCTRATMAVQMGNAAPTITLLP